MHRLPLLVAAFVCSIAFGSAQGQEVPSSPQANTPAVGPLDRPSHLPVEPLPLYSIDPRRLLRGGTEAEIDLGLSSDSLTETQLLHRLARLYSYQASILSAQADGDEEQAEDLLGLAMTELATLVQQPGIVDQARFRELYRSVVTEYERYYGVSDTLTLQLGDIFQFRADMFTALNHVNEPLLEDVMLPEIQPMHTTIPMTMNRLVEQSISYLLRQPDKHLYNWISRAETYFPMIEQILAEEGAPDELKYLAMIESGLNPRARSWARAAGMWQFIASTGRAYGLDVNSWVDERLDPEKATRAAARHLRDLHKLFDSDWQLALAGYNCSPARVKRAIRLAEQRLSRKATFWDAYPYLPRETRNYVPMFIAAAVVTSNTDAFNVREVTPGPHYQYDYVPIRGMLSLSDIAELAGTDEATIRALNPELRRSTLPPSKEPYYVRMPLGTYGQFAEGYAQLPDEMKRVTVKEYTIRRGDSLGKIAKQHGVTVTGLMHANGLKSTMIRPGQSLIIPLPAYRSTGAALTLADAKPVTIKYGGRSVRPIAYGTPQAPRSQEPATPFVTVSAPVAEQEPEAASEEAPRSTPAQAEEEEAKPASETRVVYRVRHGDTLIEIAQKYNVSVSSLRRWNNISGSQIRSGQRLYIYTSGPAPEAPSQPERVVYRVRRGDTLIEIAQKYNVSVSSLRRWNNISGSQIRSGQRLTIHPGQSATEAEPIVYRVRRGDSLSTIARKHGVSISDLKRWNGLKSSTIKSGQRLKIYG